MLTGKKIPEIKKKKNSAICYLQNKEHMIKQFQVHKAKVENYFENQFKNIPSIQDNSNL